MLLDDDSFETNHEYAELTHQAGVVKEEVKCWVTRRLVSKQKELDVSIPDSQEVVINNLHYRLHDFVTKRSELLPATTFLQHYTDSIKNFSFRPVLIHINGVQDNLLDASYFAKIIDAGLWLKA